MDELKRRLAVARWYLQASLAGETECCELTIAAWRRRIAELQREIEELQK